MKLIKMKKLIEVQKLLRNEIEMESWGRDGHAKVCVSTFALVVSIQVFFVSPSTKRFIFYSCAAGESLN